MSYLSASQVSCIQRCEREYLLKYVVKLPEEKSEPLYFGSAFDRLVDHPEEIETIPLDNLPETEYPYRKVLQKMVESAKAATRHLPKVVCTQFELSTSLVKGYVDAVRVDDSGDWYLSERKTAGRIEHDKRLMLQNDIQVATYVANAELVARDLQLDMARFKGLTYETTQKPTERLKKTESLDEFAERATCHTEVWTVPETLHAHCLKVFNTTFSMALNRREEIEKAFSDSGDIYNVSGNTSQCFRYGSKCQFFNVCHNISEEEPQSE